MIINFNKYIIRVSLNLNMLILALNNNYFKLLYLFSHSCLSDLKSQKE